MSDTYTAQTAELDEAQALDKIVLFALDEAREKLEQSGELEPFTIVLHGENLHIESHPGEDVEECFSQASQAVLNLAHVLKAYVFAYDGYINTDSGRRDAIIVERGMPKQETAQAFALLYTIDERGGGSLSFEEGVYDLGQAPSLLRGEEITGTEIDECEA